jgi:transposase
MSLLHDWVSGLDVHKVVVAACVRTTECRHVQRHAARFGATTSQLMVLVDWLRSHGASHAAMEAMGAYWRPVWHVLEENFTLLLANAREVRNLPGRKSNTSDAARLANLVAHGLIRGSVVPAPVDQELRDLTSTRRQLTREAVKHVQRIQKLLEGASCRLSSVLAETLGRSGRRILDDFVDGESDPERLAARIHHPATPRNDPGHGRGSGMMLQRH